MPEATRSDIGSLYPFIASQVTQPTLSFLRPEFTRAAAWRKKARATLLEALHYSPPPCAPKPEVLSRTDHGDYLREELRFSTTPDLRVPATVLVPKGAKGRLPAIIALHDHGGFYLWGREKLLDSTEENPTLTAFKTRYYGGKSIAVELVRQGYLVIVIDMFYWGERRLLLDDDPSDWRERPQSLSPERIAAFNKRAGESEGLVGRTIHAAGFTWPGVMLWDDLRTIDYLVTRPDVDPKRIGCVGLSVGGLRTCHLAALDERIQAAVSVCWMASFPAQLRQKVNHTIGNSMIIPGLYHSLDYPDVAALALPRPLLVISGKQDPLFDQAGIQRSFETLHACYQKAGASEKLRTRLYDTPHQFNTEMQTEAWGWLAKWLKPT